MWKRRAIHLYKWLMVRRAWYRLHRRLFNVSLWGLGLLNSEDYARSGESRFLAHLPEYARTTERLVIFDIGANVGAYAAQARALCPAAELYAFEPHPASYAALKSQAAALNLQTFNLAFSDFEGQARLFNRPGDNSEHASLYRGVIAEVHQAPVVETATQVTTVDAFMQACGVPHVHLLKIDTEGSELSILRGASASLAAGRISLVQFEFGEMQAISRSFLRDFQALLPGYNLHRLLPDGLIPLADEPVFIQELFAYQNVVAIKGVTPQRSLRLMPQAPRRILPPAG